MRMLLNALISRVAEAGLAFCHPYGNSRRASTANLWEFGGPKPGVEITAVSTVGHRDRIHGDDFRTRSEFKCRAILLELLTAESRG